LPPTLAVVHINIEAIRNKDTDKYRETQRSGQDRSFDEEEEEQEEEEEVVEEEEGDEDEEEEEEEEEGHRFVSGDKHRFI